jgi:hypothetical protein
MRCAKTQGRILNEQGEMYDPGTMHPPDTRFQYYDETDSDAVSLEPFKNPSRWGYDPGVCYYRRAVDPKAFRTMDFRSLQQLLHQGDMREPETRGQLTATRPIGLVPRMDVQFLSPYRPSPPSLLTEQANAGPLLARYGKPMPTGDMIDQIYNHLLYVLDANNAKADGGAMGTWHVEPAQAVEKHVARNHQNPEAEYARTYLVMQPIQWRWATTQRYILSFAYNTFRREIDIGITVASPEGAHTEHTSREIPWNSVADYLQSDVLLYLLTKSFEQLVRSSS